MNDRESQNKQMSLLTSYMIYGNFWPVLVQKFGWQENTRECE